MLGRAANGIFWMFRYIERVENTARLLETGHRLALTRGQSSAVDEWRSILVTTGQNAAFQEQVGDYTGDAVTNFILRQRDNPASVLNIMEQARSNARAFRSMITREVWESVNESWLTFKDLTARPVTERQLGDVLTTVRNNVLGVRGAMEGSMLRNEIFNFARLGTFIERGENTARILDVKYYVLLPSISPVGSSLDNVQWEAVLRSVAGMRAYRWLNAGRMDARGIAEFLILDRRFPRSLSFCYNRLWSNLASLAREHGEEMESHHVLRDAEAKLSQTTIEEIIDQGLHEFIQDYIDGIHQLGDTIAADYRFTG